MHQLAHSGAKGRHLGLASGKQAAIRALTYGLQRVATMAAMYSTARILAGPALESLARPSTELHDWRSTGTNPKYAANCSAELKWWLCITESMLPPTCRPTAGMLWSRAISPLRPGCRSMCWSMSCCNWASCLTRNSILSARDCRIRSGVSVASAFSCRLGSSCLRFVLMVATCSAPRQTLSSLSRPRGVITFAIYWIVKTVELGFLRLEHDPATALEFALQRSERQS